MFSYEFEGRRPTVADDAFIAPTANLIGDVTLEAGASVWYGAVLRGDCGPIVIRERTKNVQDGSVLHCPPGVTTEIGPGATVAAHSMVSSGTVIPPGVLAAGAPAVVKRALAGTPAEMWVQLNPTYYPQLAGRHRAGLRAITD